MEIKVFEKRLKEKIELPPLSTLKTLLKEDSSSNKIIQKVIDELKTENYDNASIKDIDNEDYSRILSMDILTEELVGWREWDMVNFAYMELFLDNEGNVLEAQISEYGDG
jgi:hypothetical protein